MEFTHLNEKGEAVMVDVGGKQITERNAEGFAKVIMQPETLKAILGDGLKKGDCLAAARLAGIMAAKKTGELIPLCHPIPIDSVRVEFDNNGVDELYIHTFAKCTWKTGIEMEALTAASVSALTVYDMCKAIDREMVIAEVKLIHKDGGKSGEYNRYDK